MKSTLFAVCLLMAPAAFAATPASQPAQVVSFGDETVHGGRLLGPDDVIHGRKVKDHGRLIRLRTNFRTEVLESLR